MPASLLTFRKQDTQSIVVESAGGFSRSRTRHRRQTRPSVIARTAPYRLYYSLGNGPLVVVLLDATSHEMRALT
jgi:hypothetical protein